MVPIVQEKLSAITSEITEKIETYLKWCESPIEQLLLLSFIENSFTNLCFTISQSDDDKLPIITDSEGTDLVPFGLHWYNINNIRIRKDICRLIPQYEINDEFEKKKYRIDFALLWPRSDGKGDLKIAIECDGHDYHERTKVQAKSDKAKDRYLQKKGWLIARYTGSEIYKNPLSIQLDIENLAMSKDQELFEDTQKTGIT